MFKELLSFLETHQDGAGDGDQQKVFPRRQVAAAALMVEASRLDRDFGADERRTIQALLIDHFDLSAEQAQVLMALAQEEQAGTYSDWMFTQAVRRGFEIRERLEVMVMLWEVVYADGTLHRFEKTMMERVGEALGLDPSGLETARMRALANLGHPAPV